MEDVTEKRLPEFAYYFPESHWVEGETSNWVKSLLLFFDGVATLVPMRNRERAIDADPSLAGPLLDYGLLRQLEPEVLIDKSAVNLLADVLIDYVKRNDIHKLASDSSSNTLMSLSRFGYLADREMGGRLLAELKRRYLAREPDSDDADIPIDARMRGIILCLWSQILREPGKRRLGLELMPVTDKGAYVQSLTRTLEGAKPKLSRASIVKLDLEKVALNLGSVPLDEILDFRREHGAKYRAYRRALNEEVNRLSVLDEQQRAEALRDRAEQIDDIAADLNRGLRLAFSKKNLGAFALGIVGAAIALGGQNIPGAAVGATSAVWSLSKEPDVAGSFSYLFEARHQWANR